MAMLTRRGLFKRLGRSALGLAAMPLLAKLGVGQIDGSILVGTGSPTLAEIVSTTLRARSGQLADNLMRNNALFQRLEDKQTVEKS